MLARPYKGSSGGRRLLPLILGTWIVVGVGTAGYTLIEHWSLLDAFYMTVITLTTVGFSEVHPLSSAGQLFTSFLIILGVGMLAYAASVVGAFFLDGTFTRILRRRQIEMQINSLNEHCIVCGYGRTGRSVVRTLRERNTQFVVIEKDEEHVRLLEEEGVLAIQGNAHRTEILEQAAISRASALIACASDDAENVYITLSAREIRADLTIVARVEDVDAESKVRRAGANHSVSPYSFSGQRLVTAAYRPNLVQFLDSHVRGDGEYDILEFQVFEKSSFIGKSLEELMLRSRYKTTILAVRQNQGEFIPNPDPATVLHVGDIFVAFGPKDQLLVVRLECGEIA